jgi:hypothetical protein
MPDRAACSQSPPALGESWIIVTTLARFLVCSLEINRFIATDGAKRLILQPASVAVPLAIVVGIRQRSAAGLDVDRRTGRCGGGRVRCRGANGRRCAFCWPPVCCWSTPAIGSRWSRRRLRVYVLAPIAFMFAAFWWTLVHRSPRARRIAAGVLALSVAFHARLAWAQARVSLYRNREVVATAVREGRRCSRIAATSRSTEADALSVRRAPIDARLQVLTSAYRAGGRSLHWTITVQNRGGDSPSAIRYVATYRRSRRHRRSAS